MTTIWTLSVAITLAAAILIFQIVDKRRIKNGTAQRYTQNDTGEYSKRRREMLSSCKNRYKEAYQNMDVPSGSPVVAKYASIFGVEHALLEHYIWRRDNILWFFPTWESIACHILDPEFIPVYAWRGRARLSNWSIPAGYIEYYAIDEYHGFTAVYHQDESGRRYRTVFLDGADAVFSKLFPDKFFTTVQRRAYLSSTANILDLNDKISQLKLKKDQGLISGDEYVIQRDYFMRNM